MTNHAQCPDDRLDHIESALFGGDSKMGAIHQIELSKLAIEEHVRECRESRADMLKIARENKRLLIQAALSIIASIAASALIVWLKIGAQ